MNKKQLPVELQKHEIIWGIRYLLFQLVFLGPLLSMFLPMVFPKNSIPQDAVYFVINFAAVVGIFYRYLGHSAKYGITHWVRLLLSVILGFILYQIAFYALHYLTLSLKPEHQNLNDVSLGQAIQQHIWLTSFGTVFLVPLTEEILFRGLVFGALHQRNRFAAYVVSVLAFAMIHVLGYIEVQSTPDLLISFLQYIPAGLVLGGAYEYSGSILAPVLIHGIINLNATLYSIVR